MEKHLIFWLFAAGVLVLDRITKLLIVHLVPLNSSVEFGPISLVHALNTGTAFGLLKSGGILFTLIALIVSAHLIFKHSSYSARYQPLLGLVLGGALGNVADRFLYDAVIDFIDVHFWPVFNVADSAISIAIVLLIIYEWKSK